MNAGFPLGLLPDLHWLTVVAGLLAIAAAGAAAAHVLLTKREPRAALGWIGFCLVFPLLGPTLYWLLGVNRIRTRARKLVADTALAVPTEGRGAGTLEEGKVPREYAALDRIGRAVSERPLFAGNCIETLHNGEAAYPRMLAAIDAARHHIDLSTFIFDVDETGRGFIESLAAARARGVAVRVLVDGIGELYSWPRASRVLRHHDVPTARFLPPRLLPPSLHLNLRNHRKALIVDSERAFIGGMNISDRHLAEDSARKGRVIDCHFSVSGPVVGEIALIFAEDWSFATRAPLEVRRRPVEPCGGALSRPIADGPNEDLNKLVMVLLGAISGARRSIRIMTPYFLPPAGLDAALQAAALRGVAVDIVLPEKNNLRYVAWAMRNSLRELVERGVRIWYQPPPFVHSKLFVVDGHYAQVGSANLDVRSLRLNFELALEIYAHDFAAEIESHFAAVIERSRRLGLDDLDGRSLPVKLRDAVFWLLSPYL